MPASMKCASRRRTASELVASGEATRRQVYAATLVLARLHDRGMAFALTLEDMCEVPGYIAPSRRPAAAPARRAAAPRR